MCGVAGFWSTRRDRSTEQLTSVAERMSAALLHRGPDGDGVWVDAAAGVALGHRRLAVVDLTPTGAQPMSSADERYVLAFNGEIYNFRELRERLEGAGRIFRGGSDTEVLLEGIAHWGVESALRQAEGMFAFVLWDRRERALTLARDRMGEKPLYVSWVGSTLLFASDLPGLREHPDFRAEIDTASVAALLRRSCIPAPASIYRGVHKLPPGHLLTVSESTPAGTVPWRPYWDLAAVAQAASTDGSTAGAADQLDELDRALSRSVGQQMLADVPVGCFLSGGIDSSLVAALAQEQSRHAVRTFTIGFEDKGWDEAPHARAVAQHLGTDHVEHYVSAAEAVAVVPQLADIYDEPFADSSQIPTVLVSRLARQAVTVALTGDGGDELFAGYDRYRHSARLAGVVDTLPYGGRRVLARSLLAVPAGRYDTGLAAVAPLLPRAARMARPGERLHKAARLLAQPSSAGLYDVLMSTWADPGTVLALPTGDLPPLPAAPATLDQLRRLQFVDQATYLPDDLLVKVDRAAMSVSLETRVPMLAPGVVALSWSLPTSALVADGRGKQPLRALLERRLPTALTERPKQGFAVPLGSWLRGPLREWSRDLLSTAALERDGVFRSTPVLALLDEHDGGRTDRSSALWPILMFQAWRTRWA